MRIQKTLNHGNTRWRVTISLHGKRRQRFFTSRDEARAWLNSIEADSTGFWSNRTPEEQRDIVSAFNLASKRGVPIYQCILNSPAKLTPLSIPDAVEKVCQGHQTAITTPFVSQANPTTPLTVGRTVLQSDVPQGFTKPTGGVVPHPKLEAIHHRWSACQDWAILQLVHQGKLLREQPVQGRKAA